MCCQHKLFPYFSLQNHHKQMNLYIYAKSTHNKSNIIMCSDFNCVLLFIHRKTQRIFAKYSNDYIHGKLSERSNFQNDFLALKLLTLDNSFLSMMATIQVGNRDTLTSVAARFDTTPGELTSLNKLNSSFIYPGQSLLVPDKTASSGENISDLGNDVAIQNIPSEKTRKLSTEEVQQEEKERGN